MRNLYLITHTESLHHVQNLGGGWFDSSLTEHGKFQASQIAVFLKDSLKNEPISFYCSDLIRAVQTCEIVSNQFGTGFVKHPDLREMCYGIAEGKPQNWISEHIKCKPENQKDRLDHKIFTGAESRRDLGHRTSNCLTTILGDPSVNIVIITHGFAATFLIMAWLKVPVVHMDYCNFKISPGSITLLQEDDTFTNRSIAYLNYTDHLKVNERC
jgi:probable phosphoglycerate mutase